MAILGGEKRSPLVNYRLSISTCATNPCFHEPPLEAAACRPSCCRHVVAGLINCPGLLFGGAVTQLLAAAVILMACYLPRSQSGCTQAVELFVRSGLNTAQSK